MLQHHHRTQLAEAEARLQRTLAAQRAEHEAGLERHLGFIDRWVGRVKECLREVDSGVGDWFALRGALGPQLGV